MAIISANVQYNRGEHLLLDYSSLQEKYSVALDWAKDPYSNAAIGQFIYIANTETIGEGDLAVTYAKGPYVVDAIGEGAVLTPLSKSVAGEQDLSGAVSDLATRVSGVEGKVNVAANSGLDATSALKVKIDSTVEGNILQVSDNGLSVVASQSEYSLVSVDQDTDSPFAGQYNFKKDDEIIGTINIPKDQFLKDASFHATAEEGVAVEAPYLKFVWDLDINEDLDGIQNVTYVPVKDLVDTYTAGNYITITDNVIDVNYDKVALNLTDTLKLAEKWEAIHANTTAIGDANSGLVADVAKNTEDISGVAKALDTAFNGIDARINGISSTVTGHTTQINDLTANLTNVKVKDVDVTTSYGVGLSLDGTNVKVNVDIETLASEVSSRHSVATPVAEDITVADFGTYKNTNVQAVLQAIDQNVSNISQNVTASLTGVVKTISSGNGISVVKNSDDTRTISIKTAANSALKAGDNGLDIFWSEL